eukprot:6492077-Amphidinium_carterae.2
MELDTLATFSFPTGRLATVGSTEQPRAQTTRRSVRNPSQVGRARNSPLPVAPSSSALIDTPPPGKPHCPLVGKRNLTVCFGLYPIMHPAFSHSWSHFAMA